MFCKRFRKMVFGVVALLLSSAHLMALDPTEQTQDQKLAVLQEWLKETIEKEYSIDELKHLKMINLHGKMLKELPPEIGALESLEELYLSLNLLTALPPEIAKLEKLHTISLDSNQLKEFPPEICELKNLKTISLYNNELTELPPKIGNLTNLELLILEKNELTALPPEIGNLTKLKWLEVHVNNITELPPEIASLSNLGELHIDEVNKGLSFLLKLTKKKLKILFVGGNPYQGKDKIKTYILSRQGQFTKGAGM